MKQLLVLLVLLLIGCTSQGYLFVNASKEDVIITGSYSGALPLVWSFGNTTPLTFLKKSFSCDILYRDSILSIEEYLNLEISNFIKLPKTSNQYKVSERDYYNYLKEQGHLLSPVEESISRNLVNLNDTTFVHLTEIDRVVTIVVHPNGYVPVASRPHFPLRSVKHQTKCFPFWRPMEIITPKDTLKFDEFELKCPVQLKPKNGFKVINGMVVLFEYD